MLLSDNSMAARKLLITLLKFPPKLNITAVKNKMREKQQGPWSREPESIAKFSR